MSAKLCRSVEGRVAVAAAPFSPMKLKLVLVPLMQGAEQLIRIVAIFERAHVGLQISENVLSVPRSFNINHEVRGNR
jgi:hypothetical protein